MTLWKVMLAVGLATAAWCAAAAPAKATFGSRTAADEPQYLLSALSLWEDGNLDIADELSAERWREFHEAALPQQTRNLDGGQRLSPHDALLPVILALPMGLGGWLGAKLAMAAMAGVLAAVLVWVAVRRLAVPISIAMLTTLAFALTAPMVGYGAQVYPELPAALAVTVAIAALTGPLEHRGLVVLGLAVVALPWLSVKYAPVAAGLVLVELIRLDRRGDRRDAVGLAVALALAGIGYLMFHRAVYGGWTVYAAGDHFVGGELTVAGSAPNYGGRSIRLVGLLTDRVFGLVAWAPVWLLAVPAVAALVRRRPRGWSALVVPAAIGWLVATFVALTMHGYWWPGRQVVVILPALVLAVSWWLATSTRRWPVPALLVTAALSVVIWGWLLVDVLQQRVAVVFDFDLTRNPLYRVWRVVLPDYRRLEAADWVLHGAWIVLIGLVAIAGWRSVTPQLSSTTKESTDDDAMGPAGRRFDAGVPVGGVGVR